MSKILIIEDEEALRETVAEVLSLAGYEIVEAKDGLDGLEKVHKVVPDLILCDVMMPKLNGYGFLEQHLDSDYSYIPVVLLTAKIEFDDGVNSLSLGAKGFIIKPFTILELYQVIRSCLSS